MFISSAILAILFLAAGYLTSICHLPPNPSSSSNQSRYKTDKIRLITGKAPWIFSFFTALAFIYQALMTILSPGENGQLSSYVCPSADHLNPDMLSWNTRTVASFVAVILGAFTRLSAYGGLGRNFTFHLAAPDQLVTWGIYRYVQHPSYTGLVLVLMGDVGLSMRSETALLACWSNDAVYDFVLDWGYLLIIALSMLGFTMFGLRVRDEERMMKEHFGKEWVEWHRRTARFIPGVL